MKRLEEYVRELMDELHCAVIRAAGGGGCVMAALREERAQGTTEYAILVGVLVVIAILAIITFRERVSELWGEIADGINSL